MILNVIYIRSYIPFDIWAQKPEEYLQMQIWVAKAEIQFNASNARHVKRYMLVKMGMHYWNVHLCTDSKLRTLMANRYLTAKICTMRSVNVYDIPILQTVQPKCLLPERVLYIHSLRLRLPRGRPRIMFSCHRNFNSEY